MPVLFISRHLAPESPLQAWADAAGFKVIAKSLLHFAPVRFVPPVDADVWFFYSSRAVEFGIPGIEKLTSPPKLAAIGAGTAAAIRKAGFTVDFVGEGSPAEVARQLADAGLGQTIFFPRARQSRQSVQRMLPGSIKVLDAICYDNQIISNVPQVTADAYVFTSPLNVKGYCQQNTLPERATVVAIGPSTSQALQKLGIKHHTAPVATITSITRLLATFYPPA